MQEKKGLLKKRDIPHQPKKQLGNTLVPVIIALAISMVATIAFIKQGSNLSNTTNQLIAQNEISEYIGLWNKKKAVIAILDMDSTDFPPQAINTYGLTTDFLIPPFNTVRALSYGVPTLEDCKLLKGIFNSKIYGIKQTDCNNTSSTVIQMLIRLD